MLNRRQSILYRRILLYTLVTSPILALLTTASTLPIYYGVGATSSMYPTIKPYDLVITQRTKDIRLNAIIVYNAPNNPKALIVHRIVNEIHTSYRIINISDTRNITLSRTLIPTDLPARAHIDKLILTKQDSITRVTVQEIDKTCYLTKGDNNSQIDPHMVSPEMIRGKVISIVPWWIVLFIIGVYALSWICLVVSTRRSGQ